MFILVIWFMNIGMIVLSLTAWVRLFAYLRPPHLSGRKVIVASLLFSSAITISTLSMSMLQSVRPYQQTALFEFFIFVICSFMACASVSIIVSPLFLRPLLLIGNEKIGCALSWFYGVCFGSAILLEALACFVFFLS